MLPIYFIVPKTIPPALALMRTLLFLVLTLTISANLIARPAVVVIDPGHGGWDRGGMPGQRLPEKAYTLDIATRVARALRDDGHVRVVMTRTSDYYVSLGARVNLANQYARHNAVFVSIHCNAGLRGGAFGIESYYNSKPAYRLAALIHPRVIQALGSINRGIRYRGYFVLRRNRLPAVLIECGFLTNQSEAARLSDARTRERVARAIATGIIAY